MSIFTAYDLSEPLKRWENRLTLKGLSLPEDYVNGRVKILVEFEIRCLHTVRERNADALCTIVRANYEALQGDEFAAKVSVADPFNGLDRACRQNGSVLVDYVQQMQSPKGAIPSAVWFERPDGGDCFGPSAGSLYFSFCFGFEYLSIHPERKIRFGDLPVVNFYQERRRVIEGAAKVVDGVSKTALNPRRSLCEEVNPEIVIFPVVILDQKLVRVTFLESDDFAYRLLKVSLGPFDL
jgi:hypothetical protein